jgi:leucine efflux protein
MFGIENFSSFILAVLIFQCIPGAGTIAILNATARQGYTAGLASVAGTLCGDFIFMFAAVIGLAAVLKANPIFFYSLQWLGAIYLIWMGWQLFRTKLSDVSVLNNNNQAASVFFKRSLLVTLTNPKVVLFFVSFFPLFISPKASSLTLMVMIAFVVLISAIYQTLLVVLGNKVALSLKRLPYARKLATRLAGIALIGFGVRLALNNR